MAFGSAAPLWAITAYFNPGSDARRLRNYRAFRRRLGVPLVTVELVYGAGAELDASDAESLVQLPGTDVLWQKERLLTLALERVPESTPAVAWVDADVIFERDDWPRQALERLSERPAVQLFEELVEVEAADAGESVGRPVAGGSARGGRSLASRIRHESTDVLANAHALGETVASRVRAGTGIGWAFRREVVADLGFYNGSVIGGNDRAMVCAMTGRFDLARRNWGMNDRQLEHFVAWADPFHARVRGEIGFVAQRAFHLWHGEVASRGYGVRHGEIRRFGFDPFVDVDIDRHGVLRWSSDKPELHRHVCRWLVERPREA